ncbi:hypothetical protein CF386_12100 [Paraphotobacterium marinum]|uniref:DUF1840 domain-containing protein n=1 Tax=Paraphotobacterium marinum TaxID=1755811 RepID=A0A220VHD4_9GAMM|nr:DUF1840 domain-containing protein [Paraphotobacterium marinum]ASK79777.1 hypothetical protein CF386_12100 [Paraphotobacterium marinum]
MLITFKTKNHADVVMFGDIALQLIGMMGLLKKTPGAILTEDIQQALEKLQSSLNQINSEKIGTNSVQEVSDDDEPKIPLKIRALPLIDLLKNAHKNQNNVMWS